jgi:hypothetical protein
MINTATSVQPRSEAFAEGTAGKPPLDSPTLMATQMNFASKVPGKFQISSVLDAGQAVKSGNGMSAADAKRIVPGGELKSPNGSSEGTYNVMNTTQFPTALTL